MFLQLHTSAGTDTVVLDFEARKLMRRRFCWRFVQATSITRKVETRILDKRDGGEVTAVWADLFFFIARGRMSVVVWWRHRYFTDHMLATLSAPTSPGISFRETTEPHVRRHHLTRRPSTISSFAVSHEIFNKQIDFSKFFRQLFCCN